MESKTLNPKLYNLIIGLTLIWGFLVNFFIVKTVDPTSISTAQPLVFILGYILCCFLGYAIYNISNTPIISFIGYNFIVVPMGIVLNVCLYKIAPNLIIHAILTTGIVIFIMIILATLFPETFKKMETGLFITLLTVIITEIFLLVLGIKLDFIDWIVATVFCGYIGYDWVVAQESEKTLDNAIDNAATIYVDIINLFVRVLEIAKD